MSKENKPTLVAVRDRRDEVIQILIDGFAQDLLNVETFEERVAKAHQETSVAALDTLVADLTPAPVAEKAMVPAFKVETALAESRPERRLALSIFGNVQRSGSWVPPQTLQTVAVFGNATLDFREARLGPGLTEIQATVVFGNLEVIVPPELAVECEGTAVFASFEDRSGVVADPERPLLRIRGVAVFGNVEVVTKVSKNRIKKIVDLIRR